MVASALKAAVVFAANLGCVAAASKFDWKTGQYILSDTEVIANTAVFETTTLGHACMDEAADHWAKMPRNSENRIEKEDFLNYYLNSEYGKQVTHAGSENYNMYVSYLGNTYDVAVNMIRVRGSSGTLDHHQFAQISHLPFHFISSTAAPPCTGIPALWLAQMHNDTTGACADKNADHWSSVKKHSSGEHNVERVSKADYISYFINTAFGNFTASKLNKRFYNEYVAYVGSTFDLCLNMMVSPGSPGTIGHHTFAQVARLNYGFFRIEGDPECLGKHPVS